jgi:hypothetical protein
MHEYRHKCWSLAKLPILISIMAIGLTNCSTVYTINKTDLETRLKPKTCDVSSKKPALNMLNSLYRKQYINNIDTLSCADAIGRIKTKRFNYDSKITVITHDKRTIKFYAKTLYIWKEEFLIGERTNICLHGPNYFPVKLNDIARIEVKTTWF